MHFVTEAEGRPQSQLPNGTGTLQLSDSIQHATNSKLQQAISKVQAAAQADKTGTGESHVQLLNAVRELNLAAETPAESLMRMRFEPLQSAAIRVALEAGILDAIASKDGEEVSAEDLAQTTGFDVLLIERVLRLVTWCGVVEEAGNTLYKANEATRLIVTPGLSGGEKHHFDLFFPVGANLMEYLHKTKIHQFPHPDTEEKSAFVHTFGMTMWEYMQKDGHQRRYFDDYMSTRRVGLQSWFDTYPIAKELIPGARDDRNSVFLADVGGNYGHEAAGFHAAHPDHPGRLVLQDLPAMIDSIEKGPASKRPNGVELMPYDFFTEQPIKGARAYYFRNICHDWDDRACEKFLTNTAKAMEKGYSRLLIDDYVLPNTNAPIRGSSMDFLMMVFVSGIERTKRQWDTLLDKCGLEIVKVWGQRSDYEQVIEAKLKD